MGFVHARILRALKLSYIRLLDQYEWLTGSTLEYQGVVAPWCNPQTLQPEQSGRVGSIPGRTHHLSVMTRGLRGEWLSALYSLRQVTEVKLGRMRSDSGWVTLEA